MPLFELTPRKDLVTNREMEHTRFWRETTEREHRIERRNPWHSEMDEQNVVRFIIRADDEQSARRLANANAGSERWVNGRQKRNIWLKPRFVSCKQLEPNGEPLVVLRQDRGL